MLASFKSWICLSVILVVSARVMADGATPRSVSTTGEAIVYVTPDKAVISLGIDTFDAKLADSEKANEAGGKSLVEAIKNLGIDAKQISTSDVSISIGYADMNRQSDTKGYRCVRQYAITVTDTKLVQKVIDTALANGANTLSGVDYEDSQLRKHRDEARKQAATAAKEKATALAAALDCQVIRTLTIDENAVNMWMANNYANNAQVQMASNGGGGGSADSDDSLPPGQMAVRASVNVKFEIVDAK